MQSRIIARWLLLSVVIFISFQPGRGAGEPQPAEAAKKSYQDYLDPNLPKDWAAIKLAPYEGERYEAEVPDTLDLAENARECVNYLTRLAPVEKDGWAYHILYVTYNPAILAPGGGQWKDPVFCRVHPADAGDERLEAKFRTGSQPDRAAGFHDG